MRGQIVYMEVEEHCGGLILHFLARGTLARHDIVTPSEIHVLQHI
jgi:hypothetical protein